MTFFEFCRFMGFSEYWEKYLKKQAHSHFTTSLTEELVLSRELRQAQMHSNGRPHVRARGSSAVETATCNPHPPPHLPPAHPRMPSQELEINTQLLLSDSLRTVKPSARHTCAQVQIKRQEKKHVLELSGENLILGYIQGLYILLSPLCLLFLCPKYFFFVEDNVQKTYFCTQHGANQDTSISEKSPTGRILLEGRFLRFILSYQKDFKSRTQYCLWDPKG